MLKKLEVREPWLNWLTDEPVHAPLSAFMISYETSDVQLMDSLSQVQMIITHHIVYLTGCEIKRCLHNNMYKCDVFYYTD